MFYAGINANHFNDEKVSNKGLSSSDYYGHRSVVLDPIRPFPDELLNLFNNSHQH